MPDEIKRVNYYYVSVPNKPGEGARVLAALQGTGVNLLGVSGFPQGARKSQVDLIPENDDVFVKAAKAAKLDVSRKKSGFLIQGEDHPGAVADVVGRLAESGINVTSVQVFCAGAGRYGGMLWVDSQDVRKAAKALGVT